MGDNQTTSDASGTRSAYLEKRCTDLDNQNTTASVKYDEMLAVLHKKQLALANVEERVDENDRKMKVANQDLLNCYRVESDSEKGRQLLHPYFYFPVTCSLSLPVSRPSAIFPPD
jgi:hypothetical protein